MRILLVEDDRKSATFVANALRAEGFLVEVINNAEDAVVALRETRFDAAVLDIMLPGRSGLELLAELRQTKNSTPVLLLSARGEVNDRVVGLNAGADDYLPKPFVIEELIARVRVLLRRKTEVTATVLQVADLILDSHTRQARRGQRPIVLTNREFALLEYLMKSPGRISTRMMILEQVWGYNFDPGSNVVDVYVHKLRSKIDAPGEPALVHGIRGAGYTVKSAAPPG